MLKYCKIHGKEYELPCKECRWLYLASLAFGTLGVDKMATKKKTVTKLKQGEKGGTRIGVRERFKVEIFDDLGWCAWGEAGTSERAREIAESNFPADKNPMYSQITEYVVFDNE
jgi:hypothetical protein